jgi:hypothetical protein
MFKKSTIVHLKRLKVPTNDDDVETKSANDDSIKKEANFDRNYNTVYDNTYQMCSLIVRLACLCLTGYSLN